MAVEMTVSGMTTAIAHWRGLAKAISYPQAGPAQNERYRRYPNGHRDVPNGHHDVGPPRKRNDHAPGVRPRGVSQPADPRGPHHRKHQPQSKKSSSPVHGCFGCMVMPALWRQHPAKPAARSSADNGSRADVVPGVSTPGRRGRPAIPCHIPPATARLGRHAAGAQAERLGGVEVDDQIEFRWLYDRQIGWFLAL